jgi:hypothetical protein
MVPVVAIVYSENAECGMRNAKNYSDRLLAFLAMVVITATISPVSVIRGWSRSFATNSAAAINFNQ